MNSPIATARIYTDFGGLAELKAGARRQSPEARKEVARQFEAMFIQIMLKSMRQAGEAAGTGESDQVKFYRQMFDQQIALELANSQTIGLAGFLERQLESRGAPPASGTGMALPGRKPFATPATAVKPVVEELGPFVEAEWPPESPVQFVRRLWPAAERAAARLGVDPEVILAQAALESGWGRRTPRSGQGDSFNLFGIKADGRWRGERLTLTTLEYRDGVAVRERAAFRSYRSPTESVEDYAEFIRSNPRYRDALEKADRPLEYIGELQRAGYATDPAYAEKVGRILSGREFVQVVAELKSG